MHEFRKILLYLLGTVLLGALLAPWFFWGGKALAARGIFTFLGPLPFPKFFDRAMLVSAAVLAWPVLRSLKVQSRSELGLEADPRGWGHLGIGVTSSFVCMADYGALLVLSGAFRLRSAPDWAGCLQVIGAAAAVALIEEWLFRGLILGLLRRALLDTPAVLASAILFSIVHFLKPPVANGDAINWLSGFQVLPSCLEKFSEPALLAGGFTTLFLVGCVLGWAVLRTHALWLSVGLHAGWILAKGGFGKLARRNGGGGLPWYGDDIIVGLGALAVVAVTWGLAALLLAYAYRRRRTPRW